MRAFWGLVVVMTSHNELGDGLRGVNVFGQEAGNDDNHMYVFLSFSGVFSCFNVNVVVSKSFIMDYSSARYSGPC